jgi:hypothetical protein
MPYCIAVLMIYTNSIYKLGYRNTVYAIYLLNKTNII